MSKYSGFQELCPVTELSNSGAGVVRARVPIKCPHCSVVFVKLPIEQLKTNKASRCKKHLSECAVHQAKLKQSECARPTDLRGNQDDAVAKEVSALRAEVVTTRAELSEERGGRARDRELFDAERSSFLTERAHFASERAHFASERLFNDTARLCLANVKAWGGLRAPDDTIVSQLQSRESALKRECDHKINEFKRTAEQAYDQLNARLSSLEKANGDLKKCNSELKRKRCRVEYKLPDRLMSQSTWARKRSMIAFAPDKQPSDETKKLALPLFQQATAAEPNRAT